MESFNALLENVLDRRGPRRLAAIERLRNHHENALSRDDEIEHLRQENTNQWRTIRAILADKKKMEKELLELKQS